ncbi:MAG TPA: ABC transporter ATP-binding protein [Aggregatilineales bacterium]|nr:ABC transporter ATP-binding protein [Aggregatilineales bacterium]
MTPLPQTHTYDLRDSISKRPLIGFWKLMTGFRGFYVAAVITLAVSALAQTGASLLVRHFVDEVLPLPNFADFLLGIALGFVLLAIVQGAFSFMSGRLASQTAEGLALRIRNFMFDHIQKLSFTYHDNMKTGELLQRATSDVDAVRRFFSEQAIGVGRISLLFTVNFTALLTLHWQLALISVAVVPVIVLMSFFFFKRISDLYEHMQEQEAVVSTALQENLTGVRVVKAFARQDFERARFEEKNFEHFQRGRKFLIMHSFFWPLTDILCGAQVIGGTYVAARLAIEGSISVGTFLAYVGVIWLIINPIRNLGRLIVDMSSGLVSYNRVLEIIREDRELLTEADHQVTTDLRGEVVYNLVNFQYSNGDAVLHDITFTAKPGQRIALLGSTGSGKTSLVGLLPRFYDYTSGKLTIDGVDVRDYSRHFLRQQIGIVEQEPFLFSRTIRENITYSVGRQVSDDEVFAAAKAADAHEFILSFPDGYSTLVGERGVTLSGGQKQRVALARILLKNPRILILDDATSSVDAETEDEIRRALFKLMEGRTTFIIAHKIQTVMHADQILVMDKGRIVQRGTHHELLQEPGIYRRIYDLQSRIEDDLQEELADVG